MTIWRAVGLHRFLRAIPWGIGIVGLQLLASCLEDNFLLEVCCGPAIQVRKPDSLRFCTYWSPLPGHLRGADAVYAWRTFQRVSLFEHEHWLS